MDGSPTLSSRNNTNDNGKTPDYATGRESTLIPHAKHFYTNGMIDIRVCHHPPLVLGYLIFTVIRQIESVLFRVPRVGLAAYSESFARLLEQHDERRFGSSHDTEQLYIQDEDVKSADFARLLDLIYPL